MQNPARPIHLKFEYEKVARKHRKVVRSRILVIVGVIALVLFVCLLARPIRNGIVSVGSPLNRAEIMLNPYEHVVQVREADGVAYTRDNDPHFDERVKRILKAGYDTVYTGRLDGKP
jgi:hypothetical protein